MSLCAAASAITLMPPSITVDDHGLRVKARDYSLEVMVVEGFIVPADDLFFSSGHTPLLPRAVCSSNSMKARALAVILRASWWMT